MNEMTKARIAHGHEVVAREVLPRGCTWLLSFNKPESDMAESARERETGRQTEAEKAKGRARTQRQPVLVPRRAQLGWISECAAGFRSASCERHQSHYADEPAFCGPPSAPKPL